MKRLVVLLLSVIAMTSACTPNQINAWKQWHRTNPAAAEAFLHKAPSSSGGGGSSASSNGRCVGYEGLLAKYSPGWNVQAMSRIMYRESRCNPGAYNASGATGLLQVLRSHCGWLAPRIGGCNLTNASYNIRAAAELYRNGGSAHWAMTR
jgi:hypothetical protein